MTEATQDMARVALIGAYGYGAHYRLLLSELAERGIAEMVGIADTAPVPDAPGGVPVFDDHRELLRAVAPDVAIVCTPPYSHLQLGLDVLEAGADLLLEKPPVLDLAEHDQLMAAQTRTGRAAQVGFQSLASPALVRLREEIAAGRLGDVRGVSVLAAWQRDDAYYARSAWAGRRSIHGRPSLDGAVANPFAHALMQALAVLQQAPVRVEAAWSRVRPQIEIDETATLRVTVDGGQQVLVAVTVAGEENVDGDLVVVGSAGSAELEFRRDRLRLPGDPELATIPGKPTLLENLLAHRRFGESLLAPLAATAGFTWVMEALQAMPEPALVDAPWVSVDGPNRTLTGINAALRRCADQFALLSEIDAPWPVATGERLA